MPDRRPYIAGNWKLWGTRAQAAAYCEKLLALLPDPGRRPADVSLCVPFTALETCVEALDGSGVLVCAQNMSAEESGAYTGEVSAQMLRELGVDGVVLGHSERREYNGETDGALQDKVPAALAAGLKPILCVGETEEERQAGDMERKLRHQVGEALQDVPDERIAEVVVAYEPIWAIGTGEVATPDDAQEVCYAIRTRIAEVFSGEAAAAVRLLYGGSVKAGNVAGIMGKADVDGCLVGGASLQADEFGGICRHYEMPVL